MSLAKDFSVRNETPMSVPKPSSFAIAKSLEALDKKYDKPKMIVDIILDVAHCLEDIGAYEQALSQYKIALCKWSGNKDIEKKIQELENYLKINY